MKINLEKKLQQAVAAHRSGNLHEAEKRYLDILLIQPKHPDAHHNLGVIFVVLGKNAAALKHLKIAVEVNPNNMQYWMSYIEVLITLIIGDRPRFMVNSCRY